jgi:hypothetical protein
MRLIGLVLALVLTVVPLVAEGQQAGKVHRVGVILTTSPVAEMSGPEPVHPLMNTFVRALRASAMWTGKTSLWSGARQKGGSSGLRGS